MFINRVICESIKNRLFAEDNRIIIVYGARQVGKTTLVKDILKESFSDKRILSIDGDNYKYNDILSSRDFDKLSALVKDIDILFIDEAQKVENIGINLKILYDNFKDTLRIIVTGSSALELANKVKEALTGRHYTYYLYPISFLELEENNNPFELKNQLEQRLIFGSYPKIFAIPNMSDKKDYLDNLSTDYLYKDILELENIKNPQKLRDLLRLIAFQVGSEVSYHEIGTIIGLDRRTVESYIDLLEKTFVIFTLRGFSKNLRKEVNRKPKIYFYDLGIRNAIIGNFNYIDARNDIGALWENFLMIERIKRNKYTKHFCNQYFWRTYTKAELDYVEEYGGRLYGYEFKYTKTAKAPPSWMETYKEEKASFKCINRDNFLDFVCEESEEEDRL